MTTTASSSRFGFLGPEGSNTHLALLAYLEYASYSGSDHVSYATISKLLSALKASEAPYGILPIENALEGSVVDVLEGLMTPPVSLPIHADFMIPIQHLLIGCSDTLDTDAIHTITTHPQAYRQCRFHIEKLFGDSVQIQLATSTSEAVSNVYTQQDKGLVAIGTPLAAKRFASKGLSILHPAMADHENNVTRFLVIKQATQDDKPPMNSDSALKTSMAVQLKDRPGVLADMLLVFKAYGINLTRIESRPSRKHMGDYIFYLDAEGDVQANNKVMMFLEAESHECTMIGPYQSLGLLPVPDID